MALFWGSFWYDGIVEVRGVSFSVHGLFLKVGLKKVHRKHFEIEQKEGIADNYCLWATGNVYARFFSTAIWNADGAETGMRGMLSLGRRLRGAAATSTLLEQIEVMKNERNRKAENANTILEFEIAPVLEKKIGFCIVRY